MSEWVIQRAQAKGMKYREIEEEDAPASTYFSIRERFVNNEGFHKMVEGAFKEVDLNNSGGIDLAEFYAGILILYDKVNSIPWGGRKKPPKRKTVEDLYNIYLDVQPGDKEELDFDSFELILTTHFDQLVESVLWRILTITILFPIISVYITEAVFTIPGVEEGLGNFASIVPTVIVSALVTLLPFIEKLLVNVLSKEQKLSIRWVREKVENVVRLVLVESEKTSKVAFRMYQRMREEGFRPRKFSVWLMKSRQKVDREYQHERTSLTERRRFINSLPRD